MIIFPAIDILDGNCVRLIQGDYNQEQVYGNSPVEMAKKWEALGGKFIHIVDLNGAKSGESINKQVISEIAQAVSVPIQVGGGIRSLDVIEGYIQSGVSRVIIGTAAITDKTFLKAALDKYGDKIAVSVDARGGYVATDGWTDTSNVKATDLVKELEDYGVKTIVYTDIAKDGMLQGPNLTEQELIHSSTKMDVIASGGVTTADDVENLRKLGLYGTIIGKALYDGKIDFRDLVEDER